MTLSSMVLDQTSQNYLQQWRMRAPFGVWQMPPHSRSYCCGRFRPVLSTVGFSRVATRV
uniref:Uncharacterized protein n=1 Tax=Arundo donax TaxID=35708 RepID=A0A0A8YP27_ARUDO